MVHHHDCPFSNIAITWSPPPFLIHQSVVKRWSSIPPIIAYSSWAFPFRGLFYLVFMMFPTCHVSRFHGSLSSASSPSRQVAMHAGPGPEHYACQIKCQKKSQKCKGIKCHINCQTVWYCTAKSCRSIITSDTLPEDMRDWMSNKM